MQHYFGLFVYVVCKKLHQLYLSYLVYKICKQLLLLFTRLSTGVWVEINAGISCFA